MVRLGEKVSERDVEEMIGQVDLNRDGLMSYEGKTGESKPDQ